MRNTDIFAILLVAIVVTIRVLLWFKFRGEPRGRRLFVSTAQLVAVVLAVVVYNLFGGKHAIAITCFAIAAIVALSFMSPVRREFRMFLLAMAVVACIGLSFLSWHLRGLLLLGYMDFAIPSVRTIVTSEVEFAKVHPEAGFTCTASQLLPETYAKFNKKGRNGYVLELGGCKPAATNKPNVAFQVSARPLDQELPAFCSDQSGVLRYDENGSVEACLRNGKAW